MSTDRELLEKAAKAAGRVVGDAVDPIGRKFNPVLGLWCEGHWDGWFNPLNNDGDALRLAVKLGLGVAIDKSCSWAHPLDRRTGMDWSATEEHGTDPLAATRRAIVRAAAALGEQHECP